MTKIKVKITLDPVTVEVDKSNYQEAWDEQQSEDAESEDDMGFGEPSDEFVLEQYQEDLEEGNVELDTSESTLSVELV